jgi:hypothetical protein
MYFDDEHECEPEVVVVYRDEMKARRRLLKCRDIPEIQSGEMAEDSYWIQPAMLIE